MKAKTSLRILFFTFLIYTPGLIAQDYGLALKAGTMGPSLEVTRSFTPKFNVRIGAAALTYTSKNLQSSNQYNTDASLKLSSATALADWFPFGGSFRLSGGAVINLNKASMTLIPTKTYSDGNIEYTPDKLGVLKVDITFQKVAPYLGIGFGNPSGGNRGFGMTFDLGTFYQNAPKVSMSATNLLAPSASQSGQLQDNLKWFKFYPVLSIGLDYKF
ncbi:MAG: hypothetical protein KGJ59_02150 [Bacteroidota bacterium]|nr:hypothetical protein [Bacteroidota bacterium]